MSTRSFLRGFAPIYLGYIRDAITDIRAYASVGEETFLADRMRRGVSPTFVKSAAPTEPPY
jgi:hypothetical protein